MTRSMARTKQAAYHPDPAKATKREKAESLKAEAEAKAVTPKKAIKKEGKAGGKKADKTGPKAPTKAAPEVRGVGHVERSAQREKARRALEESFANADRRAEARAALEERRADATVGDKVPFEGAWASEARLAQTAREARVPLVDSRVWGGTPEGSPPPGHEPVLDTVEYYKAQEGAKGAKGEKGKGKESVPLDERYPSIYVGEEEDEEEKDDEAICVRCGGTGGDEQSKSSGEGGGQVREGRVVGRKLALREFRLRMRVVTQPEEKWRFVRWVGTVVGVGCGFDGELVCVQVDGEVYRNELASGVFENRVGRLVVPCRSTEGRNGVFSMETYWLAEELREVTGDTGIGSVLVTG